MKITHRQLRELIRESIEQDLSQYLDDGPLGKYVWPSMRKENTSVKENLESMSNFSKAKEEKIQFN